MEKIVVTFYKFVKLPDFTEKKTVILDYCKSQGIKGTILLAEEGINGTIAGSPDAIEAVLAFLRSDPRLGDLEIKKSPSGTEPFERMKVKLKKEIVTLGIPEVDPNDTPGTYVSAQEWNRLLEDPEVVVIDTRNQYEVDIGTFKGAQNPQTQNFRQFPEYVRENLNPRQHKKVAMFCTGGIRCEKASAFMRSNGFEEVYQLHGGILKYLEEIDPQDSLWEGECFVFDERVALVHGLDEGNHDLCLGCGHPVSEEEKNSPHYEQGICCPYCYQTLTPEKRSRQQAKWSALKRQS